jgi:hypothetical protein
MLLFIGAVSCVYLLHRSTHKFLGDESSDRPTPGGLSSAVDYSLTRGRNEVGYLTITDQGGQAFDIRGGVDGTLLDYYPVHNEENQSFHIVLVADGSYMLSQTGKRIDWDQGRKRFVKTSCWRSGTSAFDLYYEISSTPCASSSGPESRADKAPPAGTKERNFYDMIARERKSHGTSRGEFMKEPEDLNSSDLKELQENGNSEIRDFKQFLTNNRPKAAREDDTSSSDESSSSSSCDEAIEMFSKLMQNKPIEKRDYGPGLYLAGGFGACPPSDEDCVQISRQFTKYLKKYPGPKRRRKKTESSTTSDCEEFVHFRKY